MSSLVVNKHTDFDHAVHELEERLDCSN